MINKKVYDYDDVKIAIEERYVSYEQEVFEPDLSFTLGTLRSELPIILCYNDPEGTSNLDEICKGYGIISAGAPMSNIPFPFEGDDYGYKLFERFDPLRAESVTEMKKMIDGGDTLVIGCSTSARHAIALASELQLMAAVLIGPTLPETTKRIDAIGLAVPRISLIEEISRKIDVPIIATGSNSTDICKALVAGADAVLIHFGGPFEQNEDLDFVLKSIVGAIRENLIELCRSSGAKTVRDLTLRCKLVT